MIGNTMLIIQNCLMDKTVENMLKKWKPKCKKLLTIRRYGLKFKK